VSELESYFRGLAPGSDPLLAGLQQEAAVQGIPIVGPLVGRLLQMLVQATQARAVLELGAAIGYSTICLGRGLGPAGRLLTLERDPVLAQRAGDNLARAGLAGSCQVRQGQAAEVLPGLEGPYDLAFLDIDKAGYLPALGHCGRLLRPGGLLVVDNTSFSGSQDFNQALREDPAWLEAQLLCFLPGHSPERDGLALAVRA